MSAPAPRLRVGSVPYLVARPLDLGLEHEPGIDFERDLPARLVDKLRAGELDVALVSSIELFRRPGYRYLDQLAIAGRGPVSSVQLFLRRPLAELRSIALDPASRTSAVLVEIELARRGLHPALCEVEPGQDPRTAPTDAWLRIGDPALRELWGSEPPANFDPCRSWTAAEQLPFAFAVWIVRPGAAIEAQLGAFARARRRGRAAMQRLALEGAASSGLPQERLRQYLLEECCYELGAELEPALDRFGRAAHDLGRAPSHEPPPALPLAIAPTDAPS